MLNIKRKVFGVLSTVAIVVTPIAVVVSCGDKADNSSKEAKEFNLDKVSHKEFNKWMEKHFSKKTKGESLTETIVAKYKGKSVLIKKGSTGDEAEKLLSSIGWK